MKRCGRSSGASVRERSSLPHRVRTQATKHLQVEPSPSPRLLVSRRRWLPLGLGLATVGALAGGALLTRSHVRPALDPNLVAVAPFDVLDRRFQLWHEG